MTQEDKGLLLKDISARLPYGVKVLCLRDFNHKWYNLERIDIRDNEAYLTTKTFGSYLNKYVKIEVVKPYLFPLSSMTEAQQEEFDRIYADDMQVVANNLKNRLDGKPYETNLGHYRHIDWLNANHFDYRGLIEKGLAIDATGLNIY